MYTLDNGNSLPYSDLIALMGKLGRPVRITETYDKWLTLLVEALAKEDAAAVAVGGGGVYTNPLRGLRGALVARPPKFGSTGCKKHMALLAQKGFPSPPVDEAYLRLVLQSFVELGALPAI